LSAPASNWFRAAEGGLVLYLRVTPNAGRDGIDGAETRDDGATVLRVRVKALPDKGKANAGVISLLAKALGLPKSSFSLMAGETSRLKTVMVRGEVAALRARAEGLSHPPGSLATK
jgi:uncharacterized protein (TIGR00251 family)